MMYFAKDGNFGESDGLVVLDTRAWSNDDWMAVEYADDYERAAIAFEIARRYTNA